ncbi:peptidoglycan-binding domain-containing protein [Mycolicibacterium sp.]|uniref:peptidoglycan-binding domain-containing protein n=1 Tax=Mycolicibacterium sp. TaxID=2320850 RepID=UPI0035601593
MPELRLGYQGPLYDPWYDWATRYAASYAFLLGAKDGYYGADEAAFTREMQRRLGLVQDGIFGDRLASAVGYTWPGAATPPVVETRRPIWFYSNPGSGAGWDIGPGFVVGEMVAGKRWNHPGRQSLRINHQPVGSIIGGYLGLMGGDPKHSYLDVIADQKREIARLLRVNPDVIAALHARESDPTAAVAVELWFQGYSQKADGVLEAVAELFGDGGEFAVIRDRINGVIVHGNPAAPGTGIARKTFPAWLDAITHNINTDDDFYAVARDRIRPLFYEWFIRAETELPFVVYTAQIILPALLRLVAPFLAGAGGLGNPMIVTAATQAISMATGVGGGLLSGIVGQVTQTNEKPNPDLIELLSVQGVLTHLGDLIELVRALPGLQSHGAYHLPRPEFGGRDGQMVAYDIVANFRR